MQAQHHDELAGFSDVNRAVPMSPVLSRVVVAKVYLPQQLLEDNVSKLFAVLQTHLVSFELRRCAGAC